MTQTRDVVVNGAIAPAFYAAPAGKAKGAVVVCHEIFGRAPEMERVCTRLAEHGYAAILPDLYGDRFKPLCIVKCMKEIEAGDGPHIAVVKAAADVVAAESGVARDNVFVIGFCIGGGFALAVGHAFKAASVNYATVLPPTSSIEKMPPTISLWASKDKSTKKIIPVVNECLQRKGIEHETHTLSAGHAFLADGSHPVAEFATTGFLNVNQAKDAPARDEGWQKILAFFDRHA